MKKLFALIALTGIITFGASTVVFADGDTTATEQVETANTTAETMEETAQKRLLKKVNHSIR